MTRAPASREIAAVREVMHHGVITCPPQTPLREVAGLMAQHDVHYVVVSGLARGPGYREELFWGGISDVDLMRVAAAGRLDDEAGEIAATELVTVTPGDSLERAAQLMGEHDTAHLIVASADTGEPRGVISTLDVARALAPS